MVFYERNEYCQVQRLRQVGCCAGGELIDEPPGIFGELCQSRTTSPNNDPKAFVSPICGRKLIAYVYSANPEREAHQTPLPGITVLPRRVLPFVGRWQHPTCTCWSIRLALEVRLFVWHCIHTQTRRLKIGNNTVWGETGPFRLRTSALVPGKHLGIS